MDTRPIPPALRVLIAEADAHLRRVVEVVLPKFGFEVRVVDSGFALLAEIAAWHPQAVVIDADILRETGFAIAIRPFLRETTVVVSMWPDAAGIREVAHAAGWSVLVKPFSIDLLRQLLQAKASASSPKPS